MAMYQWAYLLGDLALGLIWLFVFVKRKDLRHEQLFMSLITAPLAPITQLLWFYHDYWRPQYFHTFYINGIPIGVEEALFAFFVGGIGSVLYEFIRDRRHRCGKKDHWAAIIGAVFSLIVFAVFKKIGVNTIWASSLALISSAILLVFLNKKLRADMIWSSITMVFMAIIAYVGLLSVYPELVAKFWVADGLSSLNLLKIPIEELVWFLSWGAFSGVIYESWINIKCYPSLIKIREK